MSCRLALYRDRNSPWWLDLSLADGTHFRTWHAYA